MERRVETRERKMMEPGVGSEEGVDMKGVVGKREVVSIEGEMAREEGLGFEGEVVGKWGNYRRVMERGRMDDGMNHGGMGNGDSYWLSK